MDDAVFAQLDRIIERRMAADNTPGLALALTDRERTLRVATYGFADLAARTPVTPDTLFEIGSIGKSFTSLALMLEHEAGNLDLQAPVARYLPWFAVRSAFPPITVHHLLSHTAGIIAGTDPTPGVAYQVWALRETEAATAPGTSFHYSNVGYKALGLVLERLTGQGYGDAIRSRVLAPLGMTASEPAITNALRPRLAVGYASLYDDRPAHPSHPLVPATWLETESGDGSLASTPEDMAVYLRMLLNRGRGARDRLLSEAGFAAMTQRIIAIEGGRRADLLRVRNLRVNGRRPQLRRPHRGHGRLFRGDDRRPRRRVGGLRDRQRSGSTQMRSRSRRWRYCGRRSAATRRRRRPSRRTQRSPTTRPPTRAPIAATPERSASSPRTTASS